MKVTLLDQLPEFMHNATTIQEADSHTAITTFYPRITPSINMKASAELASYAYLMLGSQNLCFIVDHRSQCSCSIILVSLWLVHITEQ